MEKVRFSGTKKGTCPGAEKGRCPGAECVGCVGNGCNEMRSYQTYCAGSRAVHCGLLVRTDWDRFVCSLTLPIAAGDSMSWYLALFIGTLVTTLKVVSASSHCTLRSVRFANLGGISLSKIAQRHTKCCRIRQ